MTPKRRKQLIVGGVVLVVLVLVVYGFLPDRAVVQVAPVRRAEMRVVVEEEGVTQVVENYTISAPAAAWLRRVDLQAGDSVAAGDPVAYLEPPRSTTLDPRSRSQAEARVTTAEAGLKRAERAAEAARVAADQAVSERTRVEGLVELGSATERMKERAVAEAESALANREAADAGVVAARAELSAARAALGTGDESGETLEASRVLRAPAAGRVLAVVQESAGMVSPGMPILSIGDTKALEVRVDVLSQDAVRIMPGARVLFDQWGGDGLLEGRVLRIEPQGFTSVSSLGVEEQRVNVIAAITTPANERGSLGAGYRVIARFIIWESQDVLQIPSSALFSTEDGWAVFAVRGGRAKLQPVEIGHRTGLAVQIASGLAQGDEVIAHPGNDLSDGDRVERGDG
jgi:HlyD family secretion protein